MLPSSPEIEALLKESNKRATSRLLLKLVPVLAVGGFGIWTREDHPLLALCIVLGVFLTVAIINLAMGLVIQIGHKDGRITRVLAAPTTLDDEASEKGWGRLSLLEDRIVFKKGFLRNRATGGVLLARVKTVSTAPYRTIAPAKSVAFETKEGETRIFLVQSPRRFLSSLDQIFRET